MHKNKELLTNAIHMNAIDACNRSTLFQFPAGVHALATNLCRIETNENHISALKIDII